MNHWMCDDKSPVLPLCDLYLMCDGRPRKPKGDPSLVSQKGSNYFLWIDPNTFKPCNLYSTSTEETAAYPVIPSLQLMWHVKRIFRSISYTMKVLKFNMKAPKFDKKHLKKAEKYLVWNIKDEDNNLNTLSSCFVIIHFFFFCLLTNSWKPF